MAQILAKSTMLKSTALMGALLCLGCSGGAEPSPTSGEATPSATKSQSPTPSPEETPQVTATATPAQGTLTMSADTATPEASASASPAPDTPTASPTAQAESPTAEPSPTVGPSPTPSATAPPETQAPTPTEINWTPPENYTVGDALQTLHFMEPVNAIRDAQNGTPRPPQVDEKNQPAGHEATPTPDGPDNPDNPDEPDDGEPLPPAYEFVDVVIHGDIVYLGGQGGLFSADISNSNNPIYAGARYNMPKVYSLAAEGNRLYAGTHTEVYAFEIDETGTLDNGIRRDPAPNGKYLGKIAARGDVLYLPMHEGGFATIDVSEEAYESPYSTQLDSLGLGQFEDATAVAVEGDFAFVADGIGGMKVVDIADPTQLSIVAEIDTPGVAQEIVLGHDTAYLGLGSAGIAVIDISDPLQLELVTVYDTVGTAFGLDFAYDHLFVASWSWVEVYEVSDPKHPRLAGLEPPTQSSFDVAVKDDFIASADWYVATWHRFDPTKIGPEIHFSEGILRFSAGEDDEIKTKAVTIFNKGDLPLEVTKLETDNPGLFLVEDEPFSVEPGAFHTIEVSVYIPPGATDFFGNLRLYTNDPDEATSHLSLQYSTTGVSVGEDAPDFTLESMTGGLVTLSELQGNVVMLAYFATW